MFSLWKSSIIGPNPCPIPPKELDRKDILIIALVYLLLLILTKGMTTGAAVAMAGRRFNVSETLLWEAAKEKLWV